MIAGTISRSRLAATIPETLANDSAVLLVPLDDTAWEAAAAWAIARACANAGRRVLLVDGTVGRFDLADGARTQVSAGITDAFFRGVPLEDVVQPQERGLFFAGPGTAPVAGDLWSHTRWKRLARGFAHEKALLLVFAPLPAADRLPIDPDRMLLLGGDRDVPPVLSARAQEWETLRVVADPPPGGSGLTARGGAPHATRSAPRAFPWAGVAVAGIALAALIAIRYVPFAGGGGEGEDTATANDSAPGGPPVVSGGSLAESIVAAVTAPPAADSLFYTIQVAAFQGESQAVEHAREYDRDDAVVTVAPVRLGVQGTTWYRVLVGAYASAGGAQAALEELYDTGRIRRAEGAILRTPHALSLGGHPAEDGAREALAALREAEIPAYIVETRGGAVRILVGAFERPDQATLLDSLLTDRGLTATLVHRTGIVR